MKKQTLVVEAESQPEHALQGQDFDILEMPVKALAAYWLSLKKLSDIKRNKKFLADEADYTAEPFIKHLLALGVTTMADERILTLARAKEATILDDYDRKFDLMRTALLAMAGGENPRATLVRLFSRFPSPPMSEESAVDLAEGIFSAIKETSSDLPTLVGIDHRAGADRILVKLLFACMWFRREGSRAGRRLLPHMRSHFFAEGLSLIIDGFELPFLEQFLTVRKRELLRQAERKTRLSIDMLMAILARHSYDEVYLVAASYLS